MYDQNTQRAVVHRRNIRYYGTASGRSGQRRSVHNPEQTRLVQLAVCVALFLIVFLWRGAFPQKMIQVRDDIQTLISTDFDFETALSNLGTSLAESDTILADLGEFYVEVFGVDSQEITPEEVLFTPPQPTGVLTEELCFLSQEPAVAVRTEHYLDLTHLGLEAVVLEQPAVTAPEEAAPVETVNQPEEPPAIPAAGTVVVVSDYTGQELPENYTMDQLSLGDLETMTPVMGHLNSVYGYRDSPINGKYQFHGGVDIGGQMGDPIAAFAAGTVEYVGKDDSYGLYLQVDHGNGVKSFYAHCSKIVVTKGQAVAIGEKLAEVGSTGDSTGPHLHLELKFNKMHLNPAYYVEFLES